MDLEFSEEQVALRRSVRDFLARECPPSLVRAVVETATPADDLWAAMVKLDWPALNVPEDCGGMGLGFIEVAVVAEELGCAVAPGPYLATATQFVPALVEAGSTEQRQRFLAPVAAGERTGALAVADHPRRWRGVGPGATATEDGDAWVLAGHKRAVMLGPDEAGSAEVVVAARVGAGDGVGLFVVAAEELALDPMRALDASRPLSTAVLDGVRVPAERVLGVPGSGTVAAALTRVLETAAVALALETVGTCQALFDLTLQHAKDRHQFGVPIGSFQAVKHKLADCFVSLERARALCYFAVAAIAEDDPRRALACAMAKAAADDCQRLVCRDAIQTFGGIGFTWEADVHLFAKRAQSSGALFGGAAEQRLAVAQLLGVGAGSPAPR